MGAYAQEPIMKKYTTTTLLVVFVSHAVEFVHFQFTPIIPITYAVADLEIYFILESVSREGKSRRAEPPRR